MAGSSRGDAPTTVCHWQRSKRQGYVVRGRSRTRPGLTLLRWQDEAEEKLTVSASHLRRDRGFVGVGRVGKYAEKEGAAESDKCDSL